MNNRIAYGFTGFLLLVAVAAWPQDEGVDAAGVREQVAQKLRAIKERVAREPGSVPGSDSVVSYRRLIEYDKLNDDLQTSRYRRLKEYNEDILENKVRALHAEIDLLNAALLEERMRNKEVRQEMEFFRTTIDDLESVEARNEEHRQRIRELTTALQSKEAELVELRRQVEWYKQRKNKRDSALEQTYQARIETLQKSAEEAQRQAAGVENEKNALAKRAGELEEVKKTLERRVGELERQIETLESRLSSQKKPVATVPIPEAGSAVDFEGPGLKARISELEQRIGASPAGDKALLYEQLGSAYVQAQSYAQAIAAYTKAIQAAPDSPDPYYYVGLLYQYVENDARKSGQMLEKYLSLAPAGRHAVKARRILEMSK